MAGLRAAIGLSAQWDVAVISKVHPVRSHSGAAQGGINAALGLAPEGRDDSPRQHAFDAIQGSDYLADRSAVVTMCEAAPEAVLELDRRGAPFSRFEVFRYDAGQAAPPRCQAYHLAVEENMSVLEALLKIQNEQDPSLAFRYACRGAICGSCAMSAILGKKTVPIHRHSWVYLLGGAALFLFTLQLAGGCLLLLYHQPTEASAHESVRRIMTEVPYGWLIRSVHVWGANLFIGCVLLHFLFMFQTPKHLPETLGVALIALGALFLLVLPLLDRNAAQDTRSPAFTAVFVTGLAGFPLGGDRLFDLLSSAVAHRKHPRQEALRPTRMNPPETQLK